MPVWSPPHLLARGLLFLLADSKELCPSSEIHYRFNENCEVKEYEKCVRVFSEGS